MASTIQQIETPKRARALDTSNGWQAISPELFTTADGTSIANEANGHAAWTAMTGAQSASKVVVSSGAYHGDYAVKYTPATAPNGNGDGIYMDLNTYCTVGKTYEISIFGKHATDGTSHNKHYIRLSSVSDLGAATANNTVDLTNPKRTDGHDGAFQEGQAADEAWSERFIRFTHSANTRYFGARESGSSNDGSLILDSLSIKEVKHFPNNNHGQIYSGRALEFDGVVDKLTGSTSLSTDYPDILVTKQVTMAGWINIPAFPSTGCVWYLNPSGINSRMGLTLGASGAISHQIYNGSYVQASGTININTWYRIVCTCDNSTIKLYINGILQTGTSAANSDNLGSTASNTMEIGHLDDEYYNGMISDLQIWDALWSADDVTYDYLNPESLALSNSGTSLTNSNLKLWYPMQDGHRGQQSYILDASNTGLGDEMTTNGDFSNGTTGWSVSTSASSSNDVSLSVNTSNQLVISSQGDTSSYGIAVQELATPTIAGNVYKIKIDILSVTGGGGANYIRMGTKSSAAAGALSPGNIIDNDSSFLGTGNVIYFTAPSNHTHIVIGARNDITEMIVDNISVTPVNDKNNATTVFYGDELMANGNCEVADPTTIQIGSEPMGKSDALTPATSTEQANGGSKSIKVIADSSSTYPRVHWLVGDDMGLVVGRTYIADCYVYLPASQTMNRVKIKAIHNNGSTELAGTYTSVTNTWTKLSITFTDNNIANIQILGYNNSASNVNNEYFYVDDISIKEVGVATGWTDADQQLHIPQTALQSYNELLWLKGQDIDGVESDNVLVTMSSDVWNNSDGDWNSVSCWAGFVDASFDHASMIFSIGGSTPNFYFTVSGSNTHIGYNTGNGEVFGVTLAQSTLINKCHHFVLNWKRNSNSADTAIDGTDVEFFINTEKQTLSYVSGTDSNACSTNAQSHLCLGDNESNTAAYSFTGFITEVSGWNKQLSTSEVNELFNDGKALDALTHSGVANLKGYWRNNGLSTWKNLILASTATSSTDGSAILLNEALDNSETGVDVDANHNLVANNVIVVDNEEMLITALAATNTLTVTRGCNGTAAAAHDNNSAISVYNNGVPTSTCDETMLIPSGVDGSRDSQGFIMNKQRNTSSLNLTASSDDYVDIPVEIQGSDTLAFLGVGNGFSISCWVKMNNTINTAEWIINRNDATRGYRLGISASEQINFSIEENGNLKTAITGSAITVGTWYHVVGTFNGDPTNDNDGDILLYINGVTGGGTTTNITNDSNDMDASAVVPLTVGLGHTLYANLEIDGVLMYNDVLTQAEVTRNYNATKGSHRN